MKVFFGWITSFILAVVVLGVFNAAQSVGPESAVRKWIVAVRDRKLNDGAILLTQPIGSASAQNLIYLTAGVAGADRIDLVSKQRERDTAVVVMRFSKGDFSPIRSFIVRRTVNGWQIDPNSTLDYLIKTGEVGIGPQ